MNSRVSWSVDGIDPSVRERAEAAARRAGMSLADWLNSTIGESTPPNLQATQERSYEEAPPAPVPSQETRDVADIQQRLDSITKQIDQISRPAPRGDAPRSDAPRAEVPRSEPNVARQLNDAISRLDARLSQISSQAPRPPTMQERQRQTEMVERAAAQVYRPSPPISPASFDSAIAEIAARQNELESAPTRQTPPRSAPPMAPGAPVAAPYVPPAQQQAPAYVPPQPAYTPPMPQPAPAPAGPDFSSLERHLLKITNQIESLPRPDNVDKAISSFRSELSEIRLALTEAMPRKAIDSIENEIRSLSRRIDETRQKGTDAQVLANLERALGEIYDALRTLQPAEQLKGYDEAIRNLGAKLDLILRSNDDPSTVRQLESAIAAMRAIASNVASNDALARVSQDLHTLSARVEQIARASDNRDTLANIEQRIAELTSSLAREQPSAHANSEYIENALRSLSERMDRIPASHENASAFAHLEQRIAALTSSIETSERPVASQNLNHIEHALRTLSERLDHIPASDNNASAFAHLENRIVALTSSIETREHAAARDNSQHIESALRSLSERLDRIPAGGGDHASAFAHLEQRIAALASLIETRDRPAASENSQFIESAMRSLSERLDRIPTGNDTASVLAHLEQRVTYLLERVEASGNQSGSGGASLGRVE